MNRTKQSVKNASFSLMCQAFQLIFQMLTRVFFIKTIGKDYLGLNSVFTDLLTALQLVELGIGPAIAYSLYKPLAENDKEKVKSIMNLFKNAYRIIGSIVLILGFAFTPFYRFFINETTNIQNMDLIYILFVINTGISYFYSYYRTLLISDQKKYLDILIQTGITSIYLIAQIVILYLTHNYILYVLMQILGTILINLTASKVALKQYPYLKSKDIEKLDKGTTQEIKKNVFAMVFHKVGSIVRDATDNLLISRYIGLAVAGMYANYSMITKSLSNIINQIFAAVLSSVGNLHATTNEETQREVFYNINFLNFWIAAFCTCCFGALINPFILIIADESYLLGNLVTMLISLKFYLDIMRKTPWMFCEAAGIYWQGKSKPLLEVVVNLVVSIVLVKYIGIAGIFLGTVITILFIDFTIEPYLAFKYVLKDKKYKYYIKYIIYFTITAVIYVLTNFICSIIPGTGIMSFILKTIVTVIVSNVIIVITMFRTKEFKYAYSLITKYLKSIKEKVHIKLHKG